MKRIVDPCVKFKKIIKKKNTQQQLTEQNVQTDLFCTKSCKFLKLLFVVILVYVMSLSFVYIRHAYFTVKDILILKAQISMTRTNMATEIIKALNIL